MPSALDMIATVASVVSWLRCVQPYSDRCGVTEGSAAFADEERESTQRWLRVMAVVLAASLVVIGKVVFDPVRWTIEDDNGPKCFLM